MGYLIIFSTKKNIWTCNKLWNLVPGSKASGNTFLSSIQKKEILRKSFLRKIKKEAFQNPPLLRILRTSRTLIDHPVKLASQKDLAASPFNWSPVAEIYDDWILIFSFTHLYPPSTSISTAILAFCVRDTLTKFWCGPINLLSRIISITNIKKKAVDFI